MSPITGVVPPLITDLDNGDTAVSRVPVDQQVKSILLDFKEYKEKTIAKYILLKIGSIQFETQTTKTWLEDQQTKLPPIYNRISINRTEWATLKKHMYEIALFCDQPTLVDTEIRWVLSIQRSSFGATVEKQLNLTNFHGQNLIHLRNYKLTSELGRYYALDGICMNTAVFKKVLGMEKDIDELLVPNEPIINKQLDEKNYMQNIAVSAVTNMVRVKINAIAENHIQSLLISTSAMNEGSEAQIGKNERAEIRNDTVVNHFALVWSQLDCEKFVRLATAYLLVFDTHNNADLSENSLKYEFVMVRFYQKDLIEQICINNYSNRMIANFEKV
jgi:hypothetical protein